MKTTLLILSVLLCASASARGQAVGAGAAVVTVYSENGRFYLRSTPYDAEFPTTRGSTTVYEKGRAAPLYVFETTTGQYAAYRVNPLLRAGQMSPEIQLVEKRTEPRLGRARAADPGPH